MDPLQLGALSTERGLGPEVRHFDAPLEDVVLHAVRPDGGLPHRLHDGHQVVDEDATGALGAEDLLGLATLEVGVWVQGAARVHLAAALPHLLLLRLPPLPPPRDLQLPVEVLVQKIVQVVVLLNILRFFVVLLILIDRFVFNVVIRVFVEVHDLCFLVLAAVETATF